MYLLMYLKKVHRKPRLGANSREMYLMYLQLVHGLAQLLIACVA
jgi:hypothetical protein